MKAVILFIALLTSSVVTYSQTTYSKETLEKIKEVENNITGNIILNNEKPRTIPEQMKLYNVKGMSIAVIQDHKIAWAKAYGWADESEKRPMTTETLFEPGSISKSLNAVGILKLAQDKKVDLYTDINTYLKSWKFPYDSLSKGKKITLAEILSHNAGLTVHGFPGHNINGSVPTVYQVLDGKTPAVTPAVRSEFEPGLKYQYSGGGTTISQVILTDITGKAYDEWMYKNVLKPIGMTHSSYTIPNSKSNPNRYASAYYPDGSPVLNKFHVYPEQAAAGLWMTPSDLCNYIIDMQLAYQGKKSKVLTPEMVKLHLTPYNNGPAAMGTFIQDLDGAKYFEHGAGNDGFCGQFYASLDEGYGVVIFLNTEDGSLLYDVISSVAKAYNWKNFYHEPQKKDLENGPVVIPEFILEKYKGIYLFEDQWASVEEKDGESRFYTDGRSAKMYFTSTTRFINREFKAEKEFYTDEEGNVIGYTRQVEGKAFPNAIKILNPDTLHLNVNDLGNIGWYLMERKETKKALPYFKRAVELYPDDLNAKMNLAHAYLFDTNYPSAIAIYKAHPKELIRPEYTWEEGIKNDFIYFREHHYDTKGFDQVFEELKLEKPKGY
ncbi:serine hydrolase [Fluviicola sp.]|uniref:serine hydrolase n=1 Tax=Fluviicola sp. TaxID=1917219 RepID=UPI003D2B29FD